MKRSHLQFVVFTILLVFLMFELVGHVMMSRRSRFFIRYGADNELPYRPLSNARFEDVRIVDGPTFEYTQNSLGFRDREYALSSSAPVRIVRIGDSFTYGVASDFDSSYLAVAERELQSSLGKESVEIIKAGVPGYAPAQAGIFFRKVALQFHPNIVVVGVLPNDLVDTCLGRDYLKPDRNGYLRTKPLREFCEGLLGLCDWSAGAQYVVSTLSPQLTAEHRKRYPWEDVFRPGTFEPSWRQLHTDLRAIEKTAREHGARVVFLSIPQRFNPDVLEEVQKQKYIASRVAEICQGNSNTLCLDSTDAFIEAHRLGNTNLYWPEDGHCTPEGNKVLGKFLAKSILAAGLANTNYEI